MAIVGIWHHMAVHCHTWTCSGSHLGHGASFMSKILNIFWGSGFCNMQDIINSKYMNNIVKICAKLYNKVVRLGDHSRF